MQRESRSYLWFFGSLVLILGGGLALGIAVVSVTE
jgi:hypothetical protein